ncbi:hypothetical protein BKCO1_5800021 [Neofusicoccum parvum]|uniref:Uncharacterized protein n=1 Tax=Neofusicoccum parvum TaxID=310453 RepID=A0ACB5RTW7_9PEZI|nr:hypothetical protein BKCO1_5800021 [Neofusicoccum parvum]
MVSSYFINGLENLSLRFAAVFAVVMANDLVQANAQFTTFSKLTLLPRLTPAPQALLKLAGASRLNPGEARVTSVYSGQDVVGLSYYAGLVIGPRLDHAGLYTVQCISIEKESDTTTIRKRAASYFLAPFDMFSVLLLTVSVLENDWFGVSATVMLSSLSSICGLLSYCKLQRGELVLMDNPEIGDVVITRPNGSFAVVRCSGQLAEEIFFRFNELFYITDNKIARLLLTLVSWFLLGFGIIVLANSQRKNQLLFTIAYSFNTLAHGLITALPLCIHWNMAHYKIQHEEFEQDDDTESDSFAQALWKTVVLTKGTDWIQLGDVAPRTASWDQWLREAKEMARTADVLETGEVLRWKVLEWDADDRLRDLRYDPELNAAMIARSLGPV